VDIILFFGQNLFYDSLILGCLSFIVKKKIPTYRFVMAICVSLVASLVAFLSAPFFLLIVPLLTIRIALKPLTLKGYAISALYFYTLSAFLSGVLHILRYFVNFDNLNLGWFLLISALIAISLGVIFMLQSKFLKKVYMLGEFEHNVTFYCGNTAISGVGFVDTGNALVDQRTCLPVMVVPRARVLAIEDVFSNGQIRTWELAFSVIGDDNQQMVAFRPTLLLIDDVIVKDVVVGLSETNFTNYDFLLQPEITVGRGVI